MIKTLLLGFTFILFSSVLLAVYIYTPETYETLATDAGAISSIVIEEVQERIPVSSATLEEVTLEPFSATTTQLTLDDLLKSEKSYHCTVTLKDDESSYGTVLTGLGQVRAVFNREIGNRTTRTHVLFNDSGMYVWNDGQNGLYFKTNTISDRYSGIRDLEYTCEQQTLGSDLFTLPEDLTFYTR